MKPGEASELRFQFVFPVNFREVANRAARRFAFQMFVVNMLFKRLQHTRSFDRTNFKGQFAHGATARSPQPAEAEDWSVEKSL